MRLRPLVLVGLWGACRAPGPLDLDGTEGVADTDAGGGGGGGGGGGIPGCATVCFAWDDPVVASRPVPGAAVHTTVKDCNAYGYDAGACPDGFTCGRAETTTYSSTYSVTMPHCEGRSAPYELVADLAPPVLADAVDVDLTFSMSGERWPGGGEAGRAGQIVLVDEDDRTLKFDLPSTRDGLLALGLPKGTYRVSFAAGPLGLDDTRWPHVPRTGVLEVVKAGDAAIDVAGVRVPVSVALDGVRYTTLPADVASASLVLWSPEGGSITRSLTAGAALDAPIVVPPGVWDATWTTNSYATTTTFPTGTVEEIARTEVTAADGGAFDLALRRAAVSGKVRVDGGPLPSTGTSRVTFVDARGSQTQVPIVTAASVSRYDGWVYPGTFDVLIDTAALPASAGYPSGAWRAATGVRPGALDLTATTTQAGGRLTLNGAAPAGGYRGYVKFVASNGSTSSLSIASSGDATFSGRVWGGRSDIWLDGDGAALPDMPVRLKTGVTPVTNHVLDAQADKVEITLTRDGRAIGGTGYRGSVTFTAVDAAGVPRVMTGGPAGASYSASSAFAQSGAATASGWLPRDTYALSAYTPANAETPGGQTTLGTLTVGGATRRTYDAATVRLSIEVLWDGETPPAVSPSENRGLIVVGGTSVELPATGRAKADVWLWGTATGDVMWLCYASSDCTLDTPPFQWLWYGLRW